MNAALLVAVLAAVAPWFSALGALAAPPVPTPASVQAAPRPSARATDSVRVIARDAPRLPAGFVEELVTDSLDSPVSMAIAPDGRVFVCEQAGAIRVVRDARLVARPFWVAPAHAEVEAGLLGLAFDPAFAANGRVYVSFVAQGASRR